MIISVSEFETEWCLYPAEEREEELQERQHDDEPVRALIQLDDREVAIDVAVRPEHRRVDQDGVEKEHQVDFESDRHVPAGPVPAQMWHGWAESR